MKSTSWMHAIASALLLLTACGGGDDGNSMNAANPSDADGVPASATASPKAFSAYVGSLPADDQAEPRDIENVEPPISETAEPLDIA
jgi:hypothetical protein